MCGSPAAARLEDGSQLPRAGVHAATKAAVGDHDENVSYDVVVQQVGAELAAELRRVTLAVYAVVPSSPPTRGILLADTKLELGHDPPAR
jgi:phosphoribosylaminoimidazole-succinocarboxamide synthase